MSGDILRSTRGILPTVLGIGGSSGGSSRSSPAPVPTVAHESAQAAGLAERQRRQRMSGLASTMLTGGTGIMRSASVGTTTLLGG